MMLGTFRGLENGTRLHVHEGEKGEIKVPIKGERGGFWERDG